MEQCINVRNGKGIPIVRIDRMMADMIVPYRLKVLRFWPHLGVHDVMRPFVGESSKAVSNGRRHGQRQIRRKDNGPEQHVHGAHPRNHEQWWINRYMKVRSIVVLLVDRFSLPISLRMQNSIVEDVFLEGPKYTATENHAPILNEG